jgi:hypothetical protein
MQSRGKVDISELTLEMGAYSDCLMYLLQTKLQIIQNLFIGEPNHFQTVLLEKNRFQFYHTPFARVQLRQILLPISFESNTPE